MNTNESRPARRKWSPEEWERIKNVENELRERVQESLALFDREDAGTTVTDSQDGTQPLEPEPRGSPD